MRFTADVPIENLVEDGLLIKLLNLPQIRHRRQNLPPAQSSGAVTFSEL